MSHAVLRQIIYVWNLLKQDFTFQFSCSQDASTLNAFYRGRFENDGRLLEYSKTDERYFYIDFQDEDKFEVFAKKVNLFELIWSPLPA